MVQVASQHQRQRTPYTDPHGRYSFSLTFTQVIGTINGSGRVTLVDKNAPEGSPVPVDLDLEKVLGKLPDKTFNFTRTENVLSPLVLPEGQTSMEVLHRVLRLPSVCSKRFLTSKVGRELCWQVVGNV